MPRTYNELLNEGAYTSYVNDYNGLLETAQELCETIDTMIDFVSSPYLSLTESGDTTPEQKAEIKETFLEKIKRIFNDFKAKFQKSNSSEKESIFKRMKDWFSGVKQRMSEKLKKAPPAEKQKVERVVSELEGWFTKNGWVTTNVNKSGTVTMRPATT